MNAFDKYTNEAKIHKNAIKSILTDPNLPKNDKELLISASQKGKWIGIGLQLPLISLSAIFVSKKAMNFPKEKKFITYTMGLVGYIYYYMATEAYAWHHAYKEAEPAIKSYVVEKAKLESLKLPNST